MRSLSAPKVYPPRVKAELSSQHGRWLVEWMLVIPRFTVAAAGAN